MGSCVLFGETSTTEEVEDVKFGDGKCSREGENGQSWEVQLGSGIKVDDGRRVRDGK
jgi:hypothetical protein